MFWLCVALMFLGGMAAGIYLILNGHLNIGLAVIILTFIVVGGAESGKNKTGG